MAATSTVTSCLTLSTKSAAPPLRRMRVLDIAIYGGSALMLASNFRFATEDVDIAELDQPWPDWLMTSSGELPHETAGRASGSTTA